MNTPVIFLTLIVFLSFTLGTLPYLFKTIKGEIQPNKITWLFWSIPLITILAQYLEGVLTWASLPVFMAGFAPFLIFCASFINPKAYWKLQKFDYILGVGIILSIILWAITKNIFLAITFSIIADFLAAIPTLKKSYTYPKSESIWPFFTGLFANIFSLFVMERYDFIEMAFPIYLIFICLLFTYLLRNELFQFIKNF